MELSSVSRATVGPYSAFIGRLVWFQWCETHPLGGIEVGLLLGCGAGGTPSPWYLFWKDRLPCGTLLGGSGWSVELSDGLWSFVVAVSAPWAWLCWLAPFSKANSPPGRHVSGCQGTRCMLLSPTGSAAGRPECVVSFQLQNMVCPARSVDPVGRGGALRP